MDIPVEKQQSKFSQEIAVSVDQGQYKLSTRNAIYSFGKKYTSFQKAFKAINIEKIEIKDVLVLGFGLGSVVDLLENQPTIQRITAVDIDDVILDLAKKYLYAAIKDKVNYVCSDAELFINNHQDAFDLVIFDVFIDDLTPIQFMEQSFLVKLKNVVSKNGILLFSKIDHSHKSKIENAQFEKAFSKVFTNSFSIDANGNKIFTWINS